MHLDGWMDGSRPGSALLPDMLELKMQLIKIVFKLNYEGREGDIKMFKLNRNTKLFPAIIAFLCS